MSQPIHSEAVRMPEATGKAPTLQLLLLAALLLGVLADLLIWDRQPAVSGFALWVLCFTAGYLWLRRQQDQGWPGNAALPWVAMPPVAAMLLVLRGHEAFVFLMLILMTLATTMVATLSRSAQWQDLRLPRLLQVFLQSSLKLLVGLPLVLHGLRSDATPRTRDSRASAWLRGLILTLPLLAVFTTLFYLADAGFSRILDSAGSFIGAEAGNHLIRSALFTWLAGGLLYTLLHPSENKPTEAAGEAGSVNSLAGSLGREETTVIMGSLALLFVSFTLLQLGYLFGGSTTIEMTPGLTVADYARRGFFELLIVSVLTFLVLMALGFMSREQHRFRLFAGVLLGCVFVMQASAVQRLLLYIDNFGLTLARWMAAWMLLWIAGVLGWFALTLWRKRSQGLIYGSATLAAALLLLCVASNPAARVAALNLQRHIDVGMPLDTNYLRLLGMDAVPTILSRFDELQALPRCELALQLLSAADYWKARELDGWRHFSFSRRQALQAVDARRSRLEAMRESPMACYAAP